MKKIINWTFGSFFRTLGRFAFYILIGLLLSYLLKDVKLPNLFSVLDVYALEGNLIPPSNNQFYLNYGTSQATNDGGGYNPSRIIINSYSGDWSICSQDFYAGYNSNNPSWSISSDKYFSFSLPSTSLDIGYNYDVIIYTYFSPTNVTFDGVYGITKVQNYPYNANKFSNATGSAFSSKQDFSSCLSLSTYKINIDYNRSFSHLLISFKNNSSYSGNDFLVFGYEVVKKGTISNLNDIDSTLNDDDTSQSTTTASDFFSNFSTNTHGLTGIITAPLSAIQSLTSTSCSPLVLPLPFVNQNLTLPCMRDIYTQYFGGFMQLYDIITLGIISYWVMVRIFGLVKDFKNPEHDEIEVVDL